MADTLSIKRTEAIVAALEGLEDSTKDNSDAIREIRHELGNGRTEILLKMQEILSQNERILTTQKQIQNDQRNSLGRRLVEAWIIASGYEKMVWLLAMSTPILLTWVISKGVDPLAFFQIFLTMKPETP